MPPNVVQKLVQYLPESQRKGTSHQQETWPNVPQVMKTPKKHEHFYVAFIHRFVRHAFGKMEPITRIKNISSKENVTMLGYRYTITRLIILKKRSQTQPSRSSHSRRHVHKLGTSTVAIVDFCAILELVDKDYSFTPLDQIVS